MTMTNLKVKAESIIEVFGTFKNLDLQVVAHVCKKSPEAAREAFKNKMVRRNVKKVAKDFISMNTECTYKNPPADLVNYWLKGSEDGETAEKVWIIKGDTENAKAVLNKLYEPWEGVQINSPYDCTGQWFAWEASFTETADRTFVIQHWGLDV